MKSTESLILAAAKLSGGAAKDWDEFLAAFRAYKDEQLTLMVQASPDRLQQLQGRAQSAIDLFSSLENCRDKARAIMEKLNAKR